MPWTLPYEIGPRSPNFEIPTGALNGYEIAECKLVINGPTRDPGEEEIVLVPPVKLVVVARRAMQFDVRREDGTPHPVEGLLFNHCKGWIRQFDLDVILYAPWAAREAAASLLPIVYGNALTEIANGLGAVGKRLSALASNTIVKPGPRRIQKP